MKRKCSACQETKDTIDFIKNRNAKDGSGFHNICRKCHRKAGRLRNKGVRHLQYLKRRPNQKNYELKKTYGITLEQYTIMLIKQDYLCAICGKHQSDSHKGLHIDHCRESKKVRGLLCNSCNLAIGQLKHNVTILNNAIKYLLGA